jgi:membrane-associated phospholipid phosphatase
MLNSLDRTTILYFNSFIGDNSLYNSLIENLGNNPLIRGFPVFFALATLWFKNDHLDRRPRILAGLFATCVALYISLATQFHVLVHTRPFLDNSLKLKMASPELPTGWAHPSSFPSDTATLFASLVMVVILESRLLGVVASIWSILTVAVIRMALGYHFLTDIIGGIILGGAVVYVIQTNRYVVAATKYIFIRFQKTQHVLDGLFVLFLAEAYGLFPGLIQIKSLLNLWLRR